MFLFFFFFFNDTATTEIYTLSLYDALPISPSADPAPPYGKKQGRKSQQQDRQPVGCHRRESSASDRKSTRLNSSHGYISYAVFCLKKKKKKIKRRNNDNVPNKKTNLTYIKP